MEKTITVEYKGKDYELTFTRESVAILERRGFDGEKLTSNPVTQIPLLVHGAFNAKHRFVSQDQAVEIYDEIDDRNGFLKALINLYMDIVNDITGGNDGEETEKNAVWVANF